MAGNPVVMRPPAFKVPLNGCLLAVLVALPCLQLLCRVSGIFVATVKGVSLFVACTILCGVLLRLPC